MEAVEAVLVLILTVLLLFIVMSPAKWSSSPSSASKAAAGDTELYEHPSSCISTRLDFVFSPSPAFNPYSIFDDDLAYPYNSSSSTAADGSPIPSEKPGEPALPVEDPAPSSAPAGADPAPPSAGATELAS